MFVVEIPLVLTTRRRGATSIPAEVCFVEEGKSRGRKCEKTVLTLNKSECYYGKAVLHVAYMYWDYTSIMYLLCCFSLFQLFPFVLLLARVVSTLYSD